MKLSILCQKDIPMTETELNSMSNVSSKMNQDEAARVAAVTGSIIETFGTRVIGQNHLARRLMMALIADGHVLLEGLPGLAKTTAIKTIASLSGLRFSRIQFTPDLLPADVTGTQIYDPKTSSFSVKKGPVFANLVLADEINRAPAKVQSALLEAMQEHQVTIGSETHRLEEPFLVMATQNPLEQEGTYPLPEAQLDRFMFKVKVGYGSFDDEKRMLVASSSGEWDRELKAILSRSEILRVRQLVSKIHVSDKLHHYIVSLVFASRDPDKYKLSELKPWIQVGASPRATLYLEKAARVNALLSGRDFVTPQDVKEVALDVMRHRITLSFAAEAEQMTSERIVQKIMDTVVVP
ncbi:MAG: MoxR family ATPase [Proteobacteria bacterium]|nr:MoxR family ATPase [Pseudomonadota bacterium]